ncbi:Ig-like domain-containing protein, partial [Aliikangiella maris]
MMFNLTFTRWKFFIPIVFILSSMVISGCKVDGLTFTVTVETDAEILVTSSTPASNATEVLTNTQLSVSYSEAIEADGLLIDVTLIAGTEVVSGTHQVTGDTVYFYPHNQLSGNTQYTLSVTGSLSERALEPALIFFSTESQSALSVTQVSPLPSATDVDVNSMIEVDFNQIIDTANLTLAVTQSNQAITGQSQLMGNQILFIPDQPLANGSLVSVNVNDNTADTSLFNWQFTTIAADNTSSTACHNAYNTGFALTAGHDASAIPASTSLAKGAEYIDPVYNTCIKRMTDHKVEAPKGFARVEYSRKQAFNADSSMFLVLAYNGYWHVYDADSGEYLKQLNGPASDAEVRWDSNDPNKLHYMPTYGGMKVFELDVLSNTSRVIADFTGRLPWSNAARAWTKAEGTNSADGRYWGMQVETSDFYPLGLMVWDKWTDQIVGTWDFAAHNVGRPDHTSMSPSGDYIVASWDGNSYGTTAFSRDFTQQVKLHTKSEHSDLALLPNGNDAYVAVDYQSNGGPVFMVEIQTGTRTDLFNSYVNGSATAFHFSGKAYNKPGWVLVSTYGDTATNDGSRVWMHDKVFALELKANPTILNIAFHHSVPNGYWTEPHATVNRDFTRVAFNSNWGVDLPTDIDVYQVFLPQGAITSQAPADEAPVPTETGLINKSLDTTAQRVLFVGNSLTGHFDIPGTLKQMATEKGIALSIDTEIYGGNTFENHYFREATTTKINTGDYDTVVLQGGSYEPIYETDKLMTYGGLMSDRVIAANKTPVFYMTWHHRDAYSVEAPKVRENYQALANSKQQTLNPVGIAFAKVVTDYPAIQMFSDGTHQSEAGAFLSAAMFYGFLLKQDPTLLAYNGSIDAQTAATLKQVAK